MVDLYDKLDSGAYINKLPYPSRPKKPSKALITTAADAREYADALEIYESAHEAWLKASDMYNAETQRLRKQFVQDIEAHNGTLGHPKAGLLFDKAWEYSHSEGYRAVAETYSELAELLS